MSIHRTNFNYPTLHDSHIVEWDIRSANTSIIRHYNLLPLEQVEIFEKMSSIDRKVAVGLEERKSKYFSKALQQAFTDIIEEFIEINGITEDEIVSIKKDAIFLHMGRFIPLADMSNTETPIDCLTSKLSESVQFIPKNIYDNAILLNSSMEFYHNLETNVTHVKGLSDKLIPLHKNGILSFIRSLCNKATYHNDLIHKFFKEFCEDYKGKYCDFDMYREFNGTSKYRVILSPNDFTDMEVIDESVLDYLDISYNYINIILPIMRLYL